MGKTLTENWSDSDTSAERDDRPAAPAVWPSAATSGGGAYSVPPVEGEAPKSAHPVQSSEP